MRTALLFKDDVEVNVEANQVRDGEYSRHENFVDPEYQFKVVYVKDSKGHSGPYFRLYFARDYYISMTPDRKTLYDILRKQRHYLESPWHREWEERLSSFCKIEYTIKNQQGDRKRADAFYLEGKTAIEFQHSYIDRDFEERNSFYESLGYNIVWLYDLTMMNVIDKEDGSFEILENNAKGFFRIAENPTNLMRYPVFIQVRGGAIYRVSKLGRKDIEDSRKSTIRFFTPDATFSESEFIDGIKSQEILHISKECGESLKPKGNTLLELWDKSFSQMVVEDMRTGKQIIVFAEDNGHMMRDFENPYRIRIAYVTFNKKTGKWIYNALGTFYSISVATQKEKKWRLLASVPKKAK